MEGILERIHLKQFMVFDDFELRPGRNVNVMIAPTLCGKSSLLAGIMMGLSTKLEHVGHNHKVGEFVKFGHEEANIEIEIFNHSGNYIINRHILRQCNQSTWYINNNPVTEKQVEDLMSKLNIRVDSLCQILPQERVYEFSNMNPHLLLENTVNSFGSGNLLEYHVQLKQLSETKQAIENELKDKNSSLNKEKAINRGLEAQVKLMAKEDLSLENLELFKQQLAWSNYNEQHTYVYEVYKQLNTAKETLQKDKERKDEIIAKVDRLNQNVNINLMECKCKKASGQNVESLLADLLLEAERSKESMKHIEEKYKRLKQSEMMHIEELAQLKQDLSEMECKLSDYNRTPEEEITQQINNQEADLENLTQNLTDIRNKEEKLLDTLQSTGHHLGVEQEKITRFQEKANKKVVHMQKRLPELYQAVVWLRKNANKFKGKIFEPIMLEIDIKREEYTKFVEEALPTTDLQAFVCEDLHDMKKFVSIMRDKYKLPVNVVYSGPEHEPSSSFSANVTIDQLRSFGFSMFLKDMFTAPETIMKYLCRTAEVHCIPVGSDLVDEVYDEIPSSINLFFSESNKYEVRLSKYTKEKIVSCNTIKDPNFLIGGIDLNEMATLKESAERLSEEKRKLDDKLLDLKEQQIKCQSEIILIRDDICSLKNCISEKELTESFIEYKRKKIAEAEEQIINLEEERLKSNQETNGILIKLYDEDQIIRMLVERQEAYVKECTEITLKVENDRALLEKAEQDDRSTLQQIADHADQVKKLEDNYIKVLNESKLLHAEALKICGGINDYFFSIITDGSDEPSHKIQEVLAKIDFIMDPNKILISEFEKRMKIINDLEEEIEQLKEEMKGIGAKLLETQKKWLPELNSLIEKINSNFARCFAELGCAAEVLLSFDELDNYEECGINILVQFGDKLQELNQYTQGGGERLVATAVYMIALQELAHVPFRCVDEINQGLDPVNEKQIFDLLVNLTKGDDRPQYFIFTPKLLPGLNSDLMTVTLIMNVNDEQTHCWDCQKQMQMLKFRQD